VKNADTSCRSCMVPHSSTPAVWFSVTGSMADQPHCRILQCATRQSEKSKAYFYSGATQQYVCCVFQRDRFHCNPTTLQNTAVCHQTGGISRPQVNRWGRLRMPGEIMGLEPQPPPGRFTQSPCFSGSIYVSLSGAFSLRFDGYSAMPASPAESQPQCVEDDADRTGRHRCAGQHRMKQSRHRQRN